eukprot:1292755-Amphidinium_carterae.1
MGLGGCCPEVAVGQLALWKVHKVPHVVTIERAVEVPQVSYVDVVRQVQLLREPNSRVREMTSAKVERQTEGFLATALREKEDR